MTEKQHDEEILEEIDVGDELVAWETWEFPPHDPSPAPGTSLLGSIGIALVVSSILSGNFLAWSDRGDDGGHHAT